jgi:hypothetical protein
MRALGVAPKAEIRVDAKIIHGDGWLKPGAGKTEWFKDYDCGHPGTGPFALYRRDYFNSAPSTRVQ